MVGRENIRTQLTENIVSHRAERRIMFSERERGL